MLIKRGDDQPILKVDVLDEKVSDKETEKQLKQAKEEAKNSNNAELKKS